MKTIHYKLYTNFYEVMNMEQIDFMKELMENYTK